eukprot:251152-Chlamydomonas_euryale.AAC.10
MSLNSDSAMAGGWSGGDGVGRRGRRREAILRSEDGGDAGSSLLRNVLCVEGRACSIGSCACDQLTCFVRAVRFGPERGRLYPDPPVRVVPDYSGWVRSLPEGNPAAVGGLAQIHACSSGRTQPRTPIRADMRGIYKRDILVHIEASTRILRKTRGRRCTPPAAGSTVRMITSTRAVAPAPRGALNRLRLADRSSGNCNACTSPAPTAAAVSARCVTVDAKWVVHACTVGHVGAVQLPRSLSICMASN